MTDENSASDVWIDVSVQSSGHDPRFMGMASISYPYGLQGPAISTAKFNLTAYIKHMIEQSK